MNRFAEYLQSIVRINRLDSGENNAWMFHPGMLFYSMDKWWGDYRFRATRHEGIDICYYGASGSPRLRGIRAGSLVPAMADGEVLHICNDFLGQTIIIRHQEAGDTPWPVVICYAHILPEQSLRIGDTVKKEALVARVIDTVKNPLLPPHLHISCFEILSDILPSKWDWSLFTDNSKVRMISPVFL